MVGLLMRVKLLAPHLIGDRVWPADSVLDVELVSPLMVGLDDEAVAAIARENIRVYGRWTGRPPHLLDDPPIVRTLDNNRPIMPFRSGGPR
jgi:hypothetical protein